MTTANIAKKIGAISTFEIKGEDFVVLKKDYLEELMILMKSFIDGEKMLKLGKTRSFDGFLKSVSRKKK